jgi:hypothetical protein
VPVPQEPDLAALEARRAGLYAALSRVGDFRRGALNAVWRKCGKANCRCARPGERGLGPQYYVPGWGGGKTENVHLRPGPELEKAEREVAEYEKFRVLVQQVTEVNEAICEARPAVPAAAGPAPAPAGEKGGSARRSRRRPPPR